MSKLKTHSGAKKRFSFTAKGKISYKKNGRGHLLRKKNASRLRRLREDGQISSELIDTMKKLMPYA